MFRFIVTAILSLNGCSRIDFADTWPNFVDLTTIDAILVF